MFGKAPSSQVRYSAALWLLVGVFQISSCRAEYGGFEDRNLILASVTTPNPAVQPGDRAVKVQLTVLNNTPGALTLVRANLVFSPPEGFFERTDLAGGLPVIPARGSKIVDLFVDVSLSPPKEIQIDGVVWGASSSDGRLFVDEKADAPLILKFKPDDEEPQIQDLIVTVAADEQDGPDTMSTIEEAGGAADLSLREAILIANNRFGPNKIGFSDSVFPASAPQDIWIGSSTGSPLPPLRDRGTEINAVGRGVQIRPADEVPEAVREGTVLQLDAAEIAVRGIKIAISTADIDTIRIVGSAVTIDRTIVSCSGDATGGILAQGTNLRFVDNKVSGCQRYSIKMEQCTDSVATGNAFSGAYHPGMELGAALFLDQSDRITVSGNTFLDSDVGIYVCGNDNQISDNRLNDNEVNILVSAGGSRNEIVANSVTLARLLWGDDCKNLACGVGVHIAGGVQNSLRKNLIGDNYNEGIKLSAGANNGIRPPLVTLVETNRVVGTATAPEQSVVEVFSDADDEGSDFLGETTVSGGNWELQISVPPGLNLTATVTDPDGNSSAFSNAVPATP